MAKWQGLTKPERDAIIMAAAKNQRLEAFELFGAVAREIESALRAKNAAAQGDALDAALKAIATIAHCGGHADLSQYDALTLIRRVTLPYWDKSTTADDDRAIIDAARAGKGGV